MSNLPNLVLHKALGKMIYSGNAKRYMQNKIPIWDDFDSLIEHAVRNQKATRYIDLNEDMRWALGIAALRENKQLVIDAEFGNLNELVVDILETKGSPQSLYKLYEHLVEVLIEPPPKKYAHVSYCIDSALEKEADKQACYAAEETAAKRGFCVEDYSV
ncbi:MAG: hypothetical protein RJA83_505 [Pseudomonadota bacterium]|jgi:hypothetical protein